VCAAAAKEIKLSNVKFVGGSVGCSHAPIGARSRSGPITFSVCYAPGTPAPKYETQPPALCYGPPIASSATCAAAAKALKLSDVKFDQMKLGCTQGCMPLGCDHGPLNSVCHVKVPTPPPAPTPVPGAAYELKTSGHCSMPITSFVECSRAAAELRLSETTVSDDRQYSVSYDPKGCYFEWSELKYNKSHKNTGQCTKQDKCLCKLAVTPVNGGWGHFSPWPSCSKSCDGGVSVQTRKCDSPRPAFGGKACVGSAKNTKPCNAHVCNCPTCKVTAAGHVKVGHVTEHTKGTHGPRTVHKNCGVNGALGVCTPTSVIAHTCKAAAGVCKCTCKKPTVAQSRDHHVITQLPNPFDLTNNQRPT